MYLLDTNVWLERLLSQEHAEDVIQFLARTPLSDVRLTDFALHSIGLILTRQRRPRAFVEFVQDILVEGEAELVRLRADQLLAVIKAQADSGLDFDDAYQYVAAEAHGLTLVSLDGDFDRTERGRVTPAQALGERGGHETDV